MEEIILNKIRIKPLTEKEFEKDKKLEEELIEVQKKISELSHILGDYVYMDSSPSIYVCLKKRRKDSFFKAFEKSERNLEISVKIIEGLLCSKLYSDKHLVNNAFNLKITYSDYFKLNIQVLSGTLKRLTKKILMNKSYKLYKKNELLVGECLYIYEMLFDVSSFFDELYQWKMERYKQLEAHDMLLDKGYKIFSQQYRQKASMRKRLMAMDIYRTSQSISNRYIYRNDIAVVPVSIFQLRQAIEIRILEIIGIYSIVKSDGIPEKITANSFLEIPELTESIIFPVEKSAIIKIYTWTNIFIHQGIVGTYWLLEFAHYYLADFILCDSITLKSYYEKLPEVISNFIGCDIKCLITRKTPCVDFVESQEEFNQIKNQLEKDGYKAYKDEKDKKFYEFLNGLDKSDI